VGTVIQQADLADGVDGRRVTMGGVILDRLTLAQAAERVDAFLKSGRAHQIVTVNLDFLAIAKRRLDFRAALNDADLAVADGMPLVWLSRISKPRLPERVAGVELFHAMCGRGAARGLSVFLLGAGPTAAEAAAGELRKRYPGLRIAGVFSPPFRPMSPAEDRHLVEMIKRAAPDFLFVAFGAPRQDLWIAEHRAELGVPVSMGIGCILDLLAGEVRRAPAWARRTGLEWAYRLAQEPARLWRRYLMEDAPLLASLALRSVRERTRAAA
jgi:N-acetylglucosaminyldiphosphoundecaprenol N-acetyl-beta-D-mannosaminyltransferase